MGNSLFSFYWDRIKNGAAGFRLLRISYLIGLITALSRILFAVRDLIVAWTFGRSQSLEAFILAFLIPYSFINALSSALGIAFLPRFIELRENEKRKEANEVYSTLLGVLIIISFLAMGFLIVAYSLYAPIAAASFSKEGFELMNSLMYVTAASAFLSGISGLWRGILNAKELFVQSALVSVVTPMITIALLIFVRDLGVMVLALGLLIGIIVEMSILGFLLKKRNFELLPSFGKYSISVKALFGDWWKVFFSLALFNSMGLINGFMAARRAEIGGLAVLNYGKKIVTLPNDIASITYSSVLIPYVSKIMAAQEWRRLLKLLDKWLMVIFLTTAPIVILIVITAEPLVQILYERGAFTSQDTKQVAVILIYYVVQLPFFVSFFVLLRVLSVIRKSSSTILFGILGVLLTVGFNVMFIRWLGTSGIALSTSCVYIVLSVCLYLYVRRALHPNIISKQSDHT